MSQSGFDAQSGFDTQSADVGQRPMSISRERKPKKDNSWIVFVLMGLFVFSFLVSVLVFKEDAAASGGGAASGGAAASGDAASGDAASAGGCKDGEEMVDTKCLVKCEDGKIRVGEICKDKPMLKIQTMNNATMHTVTHGREYVELGTLMYSGILKDIKLTAEVKEQGHGNLCTQFYLDIIGVGKYVASFGKHMERTREYKSISLNPTVKPDTLVQEGNRVRIKLLAPSNGCAIWIKNVVVTATVLI